MLFIKNLFLKKSILNIMKDYDMLVCKVVNGEKEPKKNL